MTENSASVHCCDYLKYRDASVRLEYEGTPYQRWVLFDANNRVTLQVVMFCPYCGHDFRADLAWRIPGRPQENQIFEAAQLAARAQTPLSGS